MPKCLDYFLEHGVADLSLRPLAAGVGTSARMLIHHFGSKDELIATVMAQVSERFQSLLRSVGENKHAGSNVMHRFWELITARENLPYLRLLFEVQVLAARNPLPYQAYLHDTSTSWLRLVETAFPPAKSRPALAALCTAVIDGLLLELLSTGNRRRTRDALALFVQQLHDVPTFRRASPRSRRTRPSPR